MYSGSRNYSTNYELNIEQYNLKNGASQFYNTNGISSSILSGVLTATQTKVYFNGTLGGTGLYYKKLTDFK